jgi:hypothetical protein
MMIKEAKESTFLPKFRSEVEWRSISMTRSYRLSQVTKAHFVLKWRRSGFGPGRAPTKLGLKLLCPTKAAHLEVNGPRMRFSWAQESPSTKGIYVGNISKSEMLDIQTFFFFSEFGSNLICHNPMRSII